MRSSQKIINCRRCTIAVKPKTIKVTVTTAGTAVQISTSAIPTAGILVEVPTSNTGGIIGPGGTDVAAANADVTAAGDSKSLSAPTINGYQEEMYLNDIYLDAENNGDVAFVTYWERK